jgi:exopolyphosphatase/guanosine-5'-triphosphate,3'-diphosphate pyrophosphatase
LIDLNAATPTHVLAATQRESKRVAVIDMGSNSFRLVVIEYVPGLSFKEIDEVRETVRLSEGMAEVPVLRSSAIERGVRAAHIYASFCRASGIDEIVCVGTSAIRDAENRQSFLRRVQDETGLSVRVLSGEEEASYAYLAAVNSIAFENGYVLNLGGGSLEIVRVEQRRLVEATSLPLGAVRVSEGFLAGDPPSAKQIGRLTEHVQEQLKSIPWFRPEPGMQIIGQGGTLRLIARLAQKRVNYPLDILHGFELGEAQIESVRRELSKLSISARAKLPGMKPDRADISLGGLVVVHEALHIAGAESMTICSQGLREGLFYERFAADTADGVALFPAVRTAAVDNLAHNYRFQEAHAHQIARLTLTMFDQLPDTLNLCGAAERELLWAASILHDIGMAIDYHDHHKHGSYLILNDGLPGYSHRELAIIALLVRYHRKGSPTADELSALLGPGDEQRLLQLCALLRLAEQLDRARDGAVRSLDLVATGKSVVLKLVLRGEEQMVLWAVQNHRDIFERAFGLPLEIVSVPAEEGA